MFQLIPLSVEVRKAPPLPTAIQVPFPYATDTILETPKVEVCVFQVTVSVEVLIGPPAPTATQIPLP